MEKKALKSSKSKQSLNSKVSFKVCKNRVAGIKKKAMELALLCDIPVCVVIIDPSGKIQTWPENHNDVQSVLDEYSEKEQARSLSAKNREHPPKKSTDGEIDPVELVKILDSKIEAIKNKIEERMVKNGAAAINVAEIDKMHPLKKSTDGEIDRVQLVKILDSKIEAIKSKIEERIVKNGAAAINVAEIDKMDNAVDLFDFDQYEIDNAAEYLDAIDFLDQEETENPGKVLDFVDLDPDQDEKTSTLIQSPHQEEISQKRRFLGSGFSDWEESSTDFSDWDQLCTDWEKFSGDFGEGAEVSTDFEVRRQIPIDSDFDMLPQLQNSDPIGSSYENPLLTGYEFPQIPLETDIAMDDPMAELLQFGDFLSGDVGNSDFSIPLMAGF
ncbi:uncharacterized protein [Coffea arabica]|uniref:MADS-box domain-containing protein n=1 Tax=Coffea arabica TaxID=13443 RepID=A0ABM4V4R2_COFAR